MVREERRPSDQSSMVCLTFSFLIILKGVLVGFYDVYDGFGNAPMLFHFYSFLCFSLSSVLSMFCFYPFFSHRLPQSSCPKKKCPEK